MKTKQLEQPPSNDKKKQKKIEKRKTIMGRKLYKAPTTELFRVELEGTFASSIVQNQDDAAVTSTGHELNVINGSEFTTDWNDGTWE